MKEYSSRKDIKVQIIEDDALIAMMLKAKISGEGYSVCETSANAEQANAIYFAEAPDILLADILLSDDDNGIDLAIEIKETNPALPVIFLTGYEIDDIKDRAMVVKPLGFFIKPVDIDEISRLIDDYFKIR
ncbi:MAG TPA: hypothetical protein DCO79_09095 [Spirochaeta sp.]|nr:hypothetical protein [Spirochaeta sp.]